MKNWLKNSNVVITGASSGIGKEIAKILILKYNCNVLGVARNEQKLKDFKNELGSFSVKDKSLKNKSKKENFDFSQQFDYVVADVSKEESWPLILEKAKQKNCNVLINNAGTMLPFTKAINVSDQDIKRVFNTNFYSVVNGCKTFSNYFIEKEQKCAIINITSVAATCSMPGQSVYSASKSAATSYSKILSSELKSKVFVGTYLPGFTKTNLFTTQDNSKPIFDEKLIKVLNIISMSANKLAKKIVKNIKRKKRYKIFGFDSKLYRFLNWVAPSKSTDLYLKIFKKINTKSFEDLFRE
ncbi:MAG: SDR family NAD(P)-dependent oxidoreductase [Clostridia bacterium]|nr:SDR family NAD(P)-dependent oxidoreductase [Clostridia bacterium]